jgi:hypothetical protein
MPHGEKLPHPQGDHKGIAIGINLRKDQPENKTPEVIDYCY